MAELKHIRSPLSSITISYMLSACFSPGLYLDCAKITDKLEIYIHGYTC